VLDGDPVAEVPGVGQVARRRAPRRRL